ncbi:hypothetical protein DSECCO2_635090 [anaerobic digester metagenome]
MNFFSYRFWAMFNVSSAVKNIRLLASFCNPVRSNSKGGCSVTVLFATAVTVAIPARWTDFNVSSASSLSSHLILEILLKSTKSLRCSNCIWKYFLTVKSLFSIYRLQIRASVGVCTRPSEYTPRPAAILNACEALIPTSQSALLRPCPAR